MLCTISIKMLLFKKKVTERKTFFPLTKNVRQPDNVVACAQSVTHNH